MTLEQFYAAVGGDYEQTLSRLPSEALVKKFVLKYVDDGTCKELAEAITNRDWATAFRAAHTLEGYRAESGIRRPLYRQLRADRGPARRQAPDRYGTLDCGG